MMDWASVIALFALLIVAIILFARVEALEEKLKEHMRASGYHVHEPPS